MTTTIRRSSLCLVLALGALAAVRPAAAGDELHGSAAPSGLSWQRGADTVALMQGDKPVWQFNYSSKLTKSYFHPVALPGGSNLTWLSPPDHVHHFALFFCWKYLNRVNYWEEPRGVPAGATRWSNVHVNARPDFSAVITMDLQYHPQGATTDLLTEKRTIRISAPSRDGSYFMDWHMESTAGDQDVVFDRTPPDTRPDGNARGGYAGLSVRLAAGLTNPRIAATADIGTLANYRYGFAAGAADINGEIDGGEVGLAFLDHPANPRFPTRWYGILDPSNPFWYLNASLLQLEPYTLVAHQKMVLRYRVHVHPQRWDGARLEREQGRFVAEAGK